AARSSGASPRSPCRHRPAWIRRWSSTGSAGTRRSAAVAPGGCCWPVPARSPGRAEGGAARCPTRSWRRSSASSSEARREGARAGPSQRWRTPACHLCSKVSDPTHRWRFSLALPGRAPDATLASVLARRATSDPESPYVRWGDEVVSAGRIDADAEALAASLSHLGIGPGDRVAVVLPPCPEFVVAVFAAAKLGGVVVPMSPRASTVDLQYMLRHSEASCAITIERGEQGDYLQVFEDLMPQLPDLQYVVTVGEEDLWYDDRIFQYEDLISAGAGRDYAAGGS